MAKQEEKEDKVIITLEFTRNINGTISTSRRIEGGGIHLYELVGLLNIAAYAYAKESERTAKEMPEGQPTKIKYKTE